MRIEPKQMARLDAVVFDGFVERLARFIRQRCGGPEAFAPALVPADDAVLEKQLREHLARAQAYGIRNEDGLATFAALAFSYAPHFDAMPRAREILEDRSMDPEARIFALFDKVVAAERRSRIPRELARS